MIFLSLSLQRAAGIQSAQPLAFVSIRAVSLQILKKGASLNLDGRGFEARVNSDASHSTGGITLKAEGCVTNIFIYSSISEAN